MTRKTARKLRVLVLLHKDLIPPESTEGYSEQQIAEWKTEYDVITTLRKLGHETRPIGLLDELGAMKQEIVDWQPHVAFNLLEEFHSVATYSQHVVGYLELLRQPYTGCNPRGMLLSHDKVLCKKILTYHRIPTPQFAVVPKDSKFKPLRKLQYPLFVKSATEDASLGIAQASVVTNEEKLRERVEFIHAQTQSDALIEEYIEGRELYVSVIGNQRLKTYPIWELSIENVPEGAPLIATRKVKWDPDYQKKLGVKTGPARNLPDGMEDRISRLCRRIYRVLELSGYARIDLRLRPDGRIYVLEANANPNLSLNEDFADSANRAGVNYKALLTRIVSLGMTYHAAWRG
ncbi:MAG: ATP-grasp domain-containing protein [Planctomycetia bacterium]|nr:ATP-grasp domain-containing protein [Planctomycetia bacterium]